MLQLTVWANEDDELNATTTPKTTAYRTPKRRISKLPITNFLLHVNQASADVNQDEGPIAIR